MDESALYGKAKSPPPNATSSPPLMPMQFTHTTSKHNHTSNNLSEILQGFQSQYKHHRHRQTHEPSTSSPTDSHPRSHSRHRSSRSSETISAMFLIATERLSQETSRANEAERQSSEILAHFKIIQQAKQRLEFELQRVKDELGLYKTQLNAAQAEIHRAQEVINKVDQQRVDAEDEARRGREKIRKLNETRSIELAMEEGRRVGYEEGTRQGRLMMHARDHDINQGRRYHRRPSLRSARDDDNDDQVSYFSYTQDEQDYPESFRSATPRSTSARRRRTSDAKRVIPPVPPAPTLPPISDNQVPSSTSNAGDNSNHPENIAVRPHPNHDSNPTMPIRPISVYNHSPTVSHRVVRLPPDGYIPTVGSNSVISLPPPHELSMPVPPTGTSLPSATEPSSNPRQERRETPKLSRQLRPNNRNKQHTGPRSEASRTSTYISESSLFDPPDSDNVEKNKDKEEIDYFTEGAKGIGSFSRAFTVERKASKANPDPISPSLPTPAQLAFLDRYNESASKLQGKFVIERPTSTDPTQRPPHSRHSNRPREIILPTPKLTGALLKPRNPDRAPEESVDDWKRERDNASSQHHSDARPQIASRSVSNITVPGIEIETPSSHTLSTPSGRTVIDPVLLTPESARSVPLPAHTQPTSEAPAPSLGLYFNHSGDQHRVSGVLPDNNFPPGFVPLSPISGMKNLDSYPSGFAPGISNGGHLPSNFMYPSSPVIRSRA